MKIDLKYIIALIVVIIAAGAFFVYMDYSEEKELKEHNIQQFKRIAEIAKKSPQAGLNHMAKALNNYKKEQGIFPVKLTDLYPNYIPEKEFIEDLDWHYEVKGNTFYLKKTIHINDNTTLEAAIGSDLKLIQKPGTMVASTGPVKTKSPAQADTKQVQKTTEKETTAVSEEKPELVAMSTTQMTSDLQTTKADSGSSQENNMNQEDLLPDKKSFTTKELGKEEQYIRDVSSNLLVWKNDNGTLGFGNIQYPNDKNIQILVNGKWRSVSN